MSLDQVGRGDLVHAGAGTKEKMALRMHAKFWPGRKPTENVTYLNDCVTEDDECFRRAAKPLDWPKDSAAEDKPPPGQQRPKSSKQPSSKLPFAESSHPPPPAPPPRGEAFNSQLKRPKSLGNPNNPSPAPRAAKGAALVQGTKEHWQRCIDEFSAQAGDHACPNTRLFFQSCI